MFCVKLFEGKSPLNDLGWTLPRTLYGSHLSVYRGSAGPQPLRISRSLAMAELSVKSFALFILWGEGCLKLANRSVIKRKSQICTLMLLKIAS